MMYEMKVSTGNKIKGSARDLNRSKKRISERTEVVESWRSQNIRQQAIVKKVTSYVFADK